MADGEGFFGLFLGWLIDVGLKRRRAGVTRFIRILSGASFLLAVVLLVFVTLRYS
jgi:hypothetical protein